MKCARPTRAAGVFEEQPSRVVDFRLPEEAFVATWYYSGQHVLTDTCVPALIHDAGVLAYVTRTIATGIESLSSGAFLHRCLAVHYRELCSLSARRVSNQFDSIRLSCLAQYLRRICIGQIGRTTV